ncbi:MAG: hypothetical protein ACIAZJ_08040 [Gimesia chilikensis]|uniref:hypothetical protein n=1 Tax=Gimesia chilikensis TaxID=2605989 RepID=UPI003794D38B
MEWKLPDPDNHSSMHDQYMTAIKSSEFREEHLDLSAFWTWESDPFKPEESLIPVPLTTEAIALADTLLIHSEFKTPSAKTLQGLIIMSPLTDDVFAIEVLSGEQSFTFNRQLRELSEDDLNRLARLLSEDPGNIFPLRYSVVAEELLIPDGEFTI